MTPKCVVVAMTLFTFFAQSMAEVENNDDNVLLQSAMKVNVPNPSAIDEEPPSILETRVNTSLGVEDLEEFEVEEAEGNKEEESWVTDHFYSKDGYKCTWKRYHRKTSSGGYAGNDKRRRILSTAKYACKNNPQCEAVVCENWFFRQPEVEAERRELCTVRASATLTDAEEYGNGYETSDTYVRECVINKKCQRPGGWCTHGGSMYKGTIDCDGDGTPDPFCMDTSRRIWSILSSDGCRGHYGRQCAGTGSTIVSGVITKSWLSRQRCKQSSTAYGGNCRRGIDTNAASNYPSNGCTHTKLEGNPWWYVMLGKRYHVMYVFVRNRGDCCQHRFNGYLKVSLDHKTCATGQRGGFIPCNKRGEMLALTAVTRTYFHFCDLQVYAFP